MQRPSTRWRRRSTVLTSAISAATLAAAALTGCGASGGGDGSGNGNGAGDSPTTTISPLGELMGWSNESPEESRRKQLQVEQLVAECMREEGWEYTPVDYDAMGRETADPDSELQATDPVAFGEKHGYGVAYYYELYEEENIGTQGGAAMPTMVARGADDPNADYVQGLSASEQEEYNESLYGKPPEAADGSGVGSAIGVAVKPEDQGCYGKSSAVVYPQNEAANDPDVQNRMNDYYENLQDSPEMQAAYEDWAACMAKDVELVGPTGAKVTTPNDMYPYVDGLKYEAMGLEAEAVSSEDLDKSGGDYYTASINADGHGVGWVGEPTKLTEAELEELRTKEIELWKLDHACAVSARIAEIQMEAEQRFVDELVAEFPELSGNDQ